VRIAQNLEHAVDVACGAGAALHRKSHRLVEHEHVGILVERDRFEEGASFFVGLVAGSARLRLIEAQRRDAHGLTRLQPVLRLRALAADPHLAFADDALNVGEAQARKARFQKTIHTHAGLVAGDGDVLHGGRHRTLSSRGGARRWGGVRGGARDHPLVFTVILRCAPRARLEG
jgi:hypothetical protein